MNLTRHFSTTAKHLQKLAPKEDASKFLARSHVVKSTRLPNGLLVVSLENNSPLSRIAAIFKGGHRYETPENAGIVHRIRNSLGLPSANYSAITINHETASYGALVQCATNRDFITYHLQGSRDGVLGAFDSSLIELLCYPKVDFYNMEDTEARLALDRATLKDNFPAYAIDVLHKAAFRESSLGCSLVSPGRKIGAHSDAEHLDFMQRHLVANNGALVALGVDHDALLELAADRFRLPVSDSAPPAMPSAKFSGGEIRKSRGGSSVSVALAVEGVSMADAKNQAIQAILASALGTGPRTSRNYGGESRLGKAIKVATKEPFSLYSVNVSYVDSGLFGVLYTCDAQDSTKVAKAIFGEYKRAASQGLQEPEIAAAKNRVKLDILNAAEHGHSLISDLAVQACIKSDASNYISPGDLAKILDSVSLNDVNQMAKKVFASKMSMASVGNVLHTPYLDELSKL